MTNEVTMRKSPVYGWEAASEVVLGQTPEGLRVLKLQTAKYSAGIAATASVCIRQDRGGYVSETHAIFSDFYRKGIAATPCARATEKAVRGVHDRALLEMDALIAEATAHYADQLPVAA